VPWFSCDTHTEIIAEGFRDKIFDIEIIAALGRALSDTNLSVTNSVVEFFTSAMTQGALRWFHGISIHTEIITEGFRDKIFDTEMVPIIRRALSDEDDYFRSSVIEIVIAAIAQGALLRFFTGYSCQNIRRGVSGQDI
jgi:hypothetical protein